MRMLAGLVAERIKTVQEQETSKAQARTEQLKKEIQRTKEVQDAQRQKELVVIANQREVEVAKQIAEREMIVVATSNLNQCQYCVVAHGAILRIRAKNPLIADQVAVNYRKADITPRQKAMLDFAVKVSMQAYAVGDEDMALLQEHGFDEEDIWDIAAIAAFFGLSNRMANVTSMRPNDEFYSLGRQPR